MMAVTIRTNNQPRLLLDWDQLTQREQSQFDYLDEDERIGRDFVRYRGYAYDIGEFMPAKGIGMTGWCGYSSDSFFSGVLFKFDRSSGRPDYDRVVMGNYYS